MVTFLISVCLLVLGYVVYGKIVDRHFGSDPKRETPATTKNDGVDFTPLPTWKIFVIQFLNIAGLGPIFGAVLGAAYGPVAYLWIVFGCIFMGAVHDYFSGMMSIRSEGANLPSIVRGLGGKFSAPLVAVLVSFLLLAIGVSFVKGPADLLVTLTGWDRALWLLIIFAYYILATMLPIDKIIGRFYPIFGLILLFMALGVAGVMVVKHLCGDVTIVELTAGSLRNYHANPESNVMIPMLFIVISCGAISGFHSTQSPLMARCMTSEKHGRSIFYGAMIAEGVVAMIWAAAAMAYFGGPEGLNEAAGKMCEVNGKMVPFNPSIAVDMVCKSWLGKVGAIIAILGVVVCPITSGDTAFRSLRLNIADLFKLDQKPILKRFYICIPIFAFAYFCCKMDFTTIWNYVGIANQTLACCVLWTASAWTIKRGKVALITSIPATFLTFVCVSYFMIAPYKSGGLAMEPNIGYIIGIAVAVVAFCFFLYRSIKTRKGLMK